MCDLDATISRASVDERYAWLYLNGFGGTCPLARERLAWLILQAERGQRYAKPMPHDPDPEFWPSSQRKKPSTGTLSLIDRIKAAYDLEEFVGRFTNLRNRHGKCFLHGETRGESFSIFETRDGNQKWKCFGACGIGGDVIDLIRAMKERGMEWQRSI